MAYKWSSRGVSTGCWRRSERKLTLNFDLAIVCGLDTVVWVERGVTPPPIIKKFHTVRDVQHEVLPPSDAFNKLYSSSSPEEEYCLTGTLFGYASHICALASFIKVKYL